MERIGIAASKMAQGNLCKYNLFVIVISCLFALFIFVICGFSVLVALFLISLVVREFVPSVSGGGWVHVAKLSLAGLAALIGVLNVVAIMKNIKLGKNKL
jgi:hypothetical protein